MTKTPEEMADEYTRCWWPDFNEVKTCGWNHLATRQAFLAGYQAAKDQVAADKVMNFPEKLDSCEHILDMEKMVDVNSSNNSNGWISVKERLPRPGQEVLVLDDKIISVKAMSTYKTWHPYYNGFSCTPSHWMELPDLPKWEG